MIYAKNKRCLTTQFHNFTKSTCSWRPNTTPRSPVDVDKAAIVISIPEAPITEARKQWQPVGDDRLPRPGVARANTAATYERPYGTTESGYADKHGSASGVYDTEGRFVPQKFEDLFAKHAAAGCDYLNFWNVLDLIKGQRMAADPVGWFHAFVEWLTTYYMLWPEDGRIKKEDVRGVYDGSVGSLGGIPTTFAFESSRDHVCKHVISVADKSTGFP